MPRYETDSILAVRYLKKGGPALTHVFDAKAEQSLCGRVKASSRAGDPSEEDAIATCKACSKKDPRNSNGPDDGPRVLKHLFQF